MWDAPIPYCGPPPLPGELWLRWNFDPVLLIGLALVPLFLRLGARRSPTSVFYFGWMIAAAALISPLCPLSVSLFSARVAQHMILLLVAAPLVAVGLPRPRPDAKLGSPLPAAAVFAALLWFWHAPAPYDATFASTWIYWLMHLSLFGSAVWLWFAMMGTSTASALSTAAAALFSSGQMSLLGAVLTFASQPRFAVHLLTTGAWGLTPLSDQQLGGAIMWVPGGLAFFAIGILSLSRLFAEGDRPTATGLR